MNNILENEEATMKTKIFSLVIMFSLLVPALAIGSEGDAMKKQHVLNPKQQCIVTIAAFTAGGDLDRLKTALNEGLDSGLTVNEINEILVQTYAYAGFPRSLNGIGTFMTAIDERKAKGIKDQRGREATPVPKDLDKDVYGAKVRAKLAGLETIPPPAAWQEFSPIIDTFLKEHLFADIFARDVLTHQDRELVTIAALSNMSGTEGQLQFHFGAALNTGLTEGQIKDFISVIESKVDTVQADRAQKVLAKVLKSRK
jgi:alkylhydroperoxidase/carboxymuconolactone decarboxylase family protein YurZ